MLGTIKRVTMTNRGKGWKLRVWRRRMLYIQCSNGEEYIMPNATYKYFSILY